MHPLEIMARSRFDHRTKLKPGAEWSGLPEKRQAQLIEEERVALRALTKCDLPASVSKVGRETLLAYGNGTDDVFRAILRALIREAKP